MQVEAQSGDLTADVVVVAVAEGGEAPRGAHEQVSELLASGEAGTAFGSVTVTVVNGQRIAVAGLGRRADADAVRAAVSGAAPASDRRGGPRGYGGGARDPSRRRDARLRRQRVPRARRSGTGARGRGRSHLWDLRHAKVA